MRFTDATHFGHGLTALPAHRFARDSFNTLKNQGYNLEHNDGHGKKYLSSTLAGLMLLAFLWDQVQEFACPLYKAARKKTRIKATLWAQMQSFLFSIDLPDWETHQARPLNMA